MKFYFRPMQPIEEVSSKLNMNDEVLNEQIDDEFAGAEPYFFAPSITKKRTIHGKTYIIRSYFAGKKDFGEVITQLAIKQAYKK